MKFYSLHEAQPIQRGWGWQDKETRRDKRSGIQSLGLKSAGSGFRGNRRGGSTRGRGRRGGRHWTSCVRIKVMTHIQLWLYWFWKLLIGDLQTTSTITRWAGKICTVKLFNGMLSCWDFAVDFVSSPLYREKKNSWPFFLPFWRGNFVRESCNF